MQRQDITKTGNSHSTLLDQLTKTAQATEKKSKPFLDFVLEVAKERKPTLKEIFSQANLAAKMAQLDDPDFFSKGDAPMGGEMGDMGETGQASPDAHVAEDVEGAKKHLVDALIAMCGGAEEAKACIDASREPQPGEEQALPESGPGMEPAMGPAMGPEPAAEMPAPMPMM